MIWNSTQLLAQIPEGILASPPAAAPADSTEDEQPVENIIPWKTPLGVGYYQTRNDSVLRWEIWPNWGSNYAYRNDVIAYRQGTIGRIDAFDISGYSPYEQEIRVDGIRMNNPITGLINYNYVPKQKIGSVEERFGANYESDIRLKRYHIVEPVSYLMYDEAKFNYRNLEFMVSQNFNERTNVEVSFWDRRGGGNYPRNSVQGNQIAFKGYHYLSQNLQIRTLYLQNQFELNEPFGYNIPEHSLFAFSEFTASPNQQNLASKSTRKDLIIGLYERPDSLGVESRGLEFSRSIDEMNLPNPIDSLFWKTRAYSISGFQWHTYGSLTNKLEASGSFFRLTEEMNLNIKNWSLLSVRSDSELPLSPRLGLIASLKTQYRSDSDVDFSGTLGSYLTGQIWDVRLNASFFNRMPTIQQKYWNTGPMQGNEALSSVQGFSLFTQFKRKIGSTMNAGVSGRFVHYTRDIFIGTDSTFVQSSSYPVLSATVFGRLTTDRINLETSATAHAINSENPTNLLDANNKPDLKLLVRNNAYIKGYVFDRATYIKAGVRTTFSPFPYYTRSFNTALQYWQTTAFEESQIQAYFRMDAELSARVRSMMIVLRWENVLDGFGQAGYFEAATLPMPGRRMLVGIRAQFRN